MILKIADKRGRTKIKKKKQFKPLSMATEDKILVGSKKTKK